VELTEAMRMTALELSEQGYEDPLAEKEIDRRARKLCNDVTPLHLLAHWLERHPEAAERIADYLLVPSPDESGENPGSGPRIAQETLHDEEPTPYPPEESDDLPDDPGAFHADLGKGYVPVRLVEVLGQTGNMKVQQVGSGVRPILVIGIGAVHSDQRERVYAILRTSKGWNNVFGFDGEDISGQIGVPPETQ
jgi:hypothetical protein